MRKFFWNGCIENGIAVITGSEARHMREVLRMSAGHEVVLCDGSGNNYSALAEQIGLDFVKFRVTERISNDFEPKLNVTLYLAHTKGERLDFAVQKAVEIGAGAIKLFRSERCITPGSANKLQRLNRIAMEAAKQCGGSRLTEITDAGELDDVLTQGGEGLKLFCYEMETAPIRESLRNMGSSASVICGPEGGFTPGEADAARRAGWETVSLGKRILRAETAPLVALSVLLYEYNDI